VEVRLLFHVVDDGVGPQKRLDKLQVESRHLRPEGLAILSSRCPNPAEEGVVVQTVCFPCRQVDEGLKLSRRRELHDVGGVAEPNRNNVEVQLLRRNGTDEGARGRRGDERL
jgi:hypothetical protein